MLDRTRYSENKYRRGGSKATTTTMTVITMILPLVINNAYSWKVCSVQDDGCGGSTIGEMVTLMLIMGTVVRGQRTRLRSRMEMKG